MLGGAGGPLAFRFLYRSGTGPFGTADKVINSFESAMFSMHIFSYFVNKKDLLLSNTLLIWMFISMFKRKQFPLSVNMLIINASSQRAKKLFIRMFTNSLYGYMYLSGYESLEKCVPLLYKKWNAHEEAKTTRQDSFTTATNKD
jgi:hypothetical protein